MSWKPTFLILSLYFIWLIVLTVMAFEKHFLILALQILIIM